MDAARAHLMLKELMIWPVDIQGADAATNLAMPCLQNRYG